MSTTLLESKGAFQAALKDWYKDAKRLLPWRQKRSIYATVVSEFMLQQTQVKTVLPYFEKWMQRFPTFEILAKAPQEEVIRHWEGLGYYSRARNLHKLAQAYVLLEQKPETAESWQALPGIGPYTSAAVSSIAQDYPAAVIDGNVVRILARLTNNDTEFKNGGDAVKSLTPLANQLLNHETPGPHNEAMMELGATVCQKHNPLCTVCPVVRYCLGAHSGAPEKLPLIRRKATIQTTVDRIWLIKDGKLLLQRIPKNAKQLAGQYELPKASDIKISPRSDEEIAKKKRSITNKRITEIIYRVNFSDKIRTTTIQDETLEWHSTQRLERLTLSGPHRRWINELLSNLKLLDERTAR